MKTSATNNLLRDEIKKAGYKLLSEIDKNQTFMVECQHGHVYKGRKNNFLNGYRCRICAREKRREKVRAQLEQILNEEGYIVLSITNDVGANAMYSLICPNNHHWTSAYSNLYQGHRCPMCNDNRSFGEKVIFNVLHKDNFSFEYQYRIREKSGSYHYLDFLVQRPNQKPLVIEYDGLQHFEEDTRDPHPKQAITIRRTRDAFKNKYAYNHKWEILRIPYSHESIKSIISALQKKLDIEYDPTYPYTTNIFDINELTKYYLNHTLAETATTHHISPATVLTWFKKRYSMSKSDYVKKYNLKGNKKETVAKYFLTNGLYKTMADKGVGRTTVSLYFKSVYGLSKTLYSEKIVNYAKENSLELAFTQFNITPDEFEIIKKNLVYKKHH